jgi:enamine deaminase RidA (YjgF/YER057c/UK114 family)
MHNIKERLKNLNIDLPVPAKALGSYVPFIQSNNLLFISGQLPINSDGSIISGKVGEEIDTSKAQEAATQCAINIVAQANLALEDNLESIEQCLKLSGYVNSIPTFKDHPLIINAASDLIKKIFLEKGIHTRIAVGCSSLPLNASVEIDAIFRIQTD